MLITFHGLGHGGKLFSSKVGGRSPTRKLLDTGAASLPPFGRRKNYSRFYAVPRHPFPPHIAHRPKSFLARRRVPLDFAARPAIRSRRFPRSLPARTRNRSPMARHTPWPRA